MSEKSLPLRLPVVLLIVAGFAIATVFLSSPQTNASLSPTQGLVTLRNLAREATPYGEALANDRPTLVEFYADWCTTCQRQAPQLAALQTQFGDAANFAMLDIDDPQWRACIDEFQITGVPEILLLDCEAVLQEHFVGAVPQTVLARKLAALVSQSPPSLSR